MSYLNSNSPRMYPELDSTSVFYCETKGSKRSCDRSGDVCDHFAYKFCQVCVCIKLVFPPVRSSLVSPRHARANI